MSARMSAKTSAKRFGLAAAAIAVCITAASTAAADQFRFSPPAGWARTLATGGLVIAAWREPAPVGFAQNINIVAQPYSGTLSQYVDLNKTQLMRTFPSAVMGGDLSGSTCGTHPAHYFAWQANLGGRDLIYEQVASVWFGRGYVVTYTRLVSQPINPDARAALTTLCIRHIGQRPTAAPAGKKPYVAPAVVPPTTPTPQPSPTPQPPNAPNGAPGELATPYAAGSPAPTETP